LGSARFLKAIKGRHKEGPVVVKIFVKSEPTFSLQAYVQQLKADASRRSPQRLRAPADRRNGQGGVPRSPVLLQQPLRSHQRIVCPHATLEPDLLISRAPVPPSTRPFLNLIEKRWIAYQLLRGVADVHGKGVCHGDIKAENVLVTSWNWVYLTDFASFKPTYLPEVGYAHRLRQVSNVRVEVTSRGWLIRLLSPPPPPPPPFFFFFAFGPH
ncbi:MAG: hypothetical protein BJ554DRAFT_3800, partial [Olpidium bornovanus]